MSDDRQRILRAAVYAGGIFSALRDRDISDEELDLVSPPADEPQRVHRQFLVAMAALILDDSDAAWRAMRELVHQNRSHLAVEDLDSLSFLFDLLVTGIAQNSESGIARACRLASSAVGLGSQPELRGAVVDCISDGVGEALTADRIRGLIALLARLDRRFAALAPNDVRDVLERVDLSSLGGKRKGGVAVLSALGAAATLSVLVGAFGDTNFENAKKAFGQAVDKRKEDLLERQKSARAELARRSRNQED